jgi:hypothetical protein
MFAGGIVEVTERQLTALKAGDAVGDRWPEVADPAGVGPAGGRNRHNATLVVAGDPTRVAFP